MRVGRKFVIIGGRYLCLPYVLAGEQLGGSVEIGQGIIMLSKEPMDFPTLRYILNVVGGEFDGTVVVR